MEKDGIDFVRILLEDVQEALDLAVKGCSPSVRRSVLRTVISAAEGVSWNYRSYILSVAREIGRATPLMELAFAEASYAVNERGDLVEQARYISLTAMIRLTTKVAQSICSDLTIDFGVGGWSDLKNAISARNRITHPKSAEDLVVSEKEIETVKVGFFWFLEMSSYVMDEVTKEFSIHVHMAREVLGLLKEGNPDILDLYNRVHQDHDD